MQKNSANSTNLNNNATYTETYLKFDSVVDRQKVWATMSKGNSLWNGKPTSISYVPRFFDNLTRDNLKEISEITHSILCKAINRFQQDSDFRKQFRLDKRVEDLALIPCVHKNPMPYGRVDFSYNEHTGLARAIEFNTDASSGMNEMAQSAIAIKSGMAFWNFSKLYDVVDSSRDLFDGWVETFIKILSSSGLNPSDTNLAIVPCYDAKNPDFTELDFFRKLFEDAGIACNIYDVKQLYFDGEHLFGKHALAGKNNQRIDAVWRWTIVSDLLENWDLVQPFLDAVRNNKVALIGGFATQIAHDKQLFAVLHKTVDDGYLNQEEAQFVKSSIPKTWFIDDKNLDLNAVINNKNKWIIKPTDMYASKRVVAGKECSQDQWEAEISACLLETRTSFVSKSDNQKTFIVQEFCDPFDTRAVGLSGCPEDFTQKPQMYSNVLGLFLYDGNFAGVYIRQGTNSVIGSDRGCIVAPVFWVND